MIFRAVAAVAALSLFLALTPPPTSAQTAYPMLMSIKPVALQAGTTADALIQSRYTMEGTYQVLISGEGVSAEVVPAETKADDSGKKSTTDKLKVRFSAISDALPGVRDVRIATPHGVSTVGQLVIVRDPVTQEAASNNTAAEAQTIYLPAAVCGTIEKAEDVDYFKFHVEAGTELVFAARCARLEDRIHDLQTHADPIVTLRSLDGVTLAVADNHVYYADPVLCHRFQEAGEYLLEIRDVRYQGNAYWEYCLEISSRPLVVTAHPLALAAGQTQSVQPLGYALADRSVNFSAPATLAPGIQYLPLPLDEEPSNPVPLLVIDLPVSLEIDEPNDAAAEAQSISVPAAICGQIAAEADIDYYAFEAKKGEAFTLEIVARRLQSALDSHVRILDEKGNQLAINDDLRLGRRGFTDSLLENWAAPADGKYFVEVRDVNLRGGKLHPYCLKLTCTQPSFDLYLDTDKTLVTPGGGAALFVRVERKNGFTGEIQLAISGLPPRVMAHCGRILAEKGQDGCIILEAASDASLAAASVIVTGTAQHTLPDGTTLQLASTAVPYQEIYQPGGGRGHWPVGQHAVAVTDPADIRGITLSTYDIHLKPGESQKIEVSIDRAEGFTANVTLDMLMRHLNTTYANTLPPGVTLNDKNAKSLLSGSATQGYLTLTAAKDAPPTDRQQAVVLAHVALNFVMKWTYASRPVTITVERHDLKAP